MSRTKLYYFGCVPVRIATAILILLGINPMVQGVSIFGCIAAIFSLGFVRKHFRNDKVGFFGGEVWWHHFRKFHAAIWALVSLLLFLDVNWVGFIILYDILPGIIEKCRRNVN